jgi:hypothetical protein
MAATLGGLVGAVAYMELSPKSEYLAGQSSPKTTSALQAVSKPHGKERGYMEEVIATNSLDAALKIRIEYGWKAGYKKRLALFGDWTLYDTDTKPTAKVKTYVAIPSGIDVIVDMKNQKYESIWIELARKSAEDFLAICTRGTPIHGPEEVFY